MFSGNDSLICMDTLTGLPFEQLFTFKRGDVTDGREDVCTMCCRTLDAVSDGHSSVRIDQTMQSEMNSPMIDTTLSSFMINIKVLQVVVKVYTSGAQVSTQ